MTDNLKPIRDLITESKINIETEIRELQTKLQNYGFKGVAIDIEKTWVKNEADITMDEHFKITIKPLL